MEPIKFINERDKNLIIFIHGFTGDQETWEILIMHLQKC